MGTFYQRSQAVTGVVAGTHFTLRLAYGEPETTTAIQVAPAKGATTYDYFYSDQGAVEAGTAPSGQFTIPLRITNGSTDLTISVQFQRVSADGATVLATSDYTAGQVGVSGTQTHLALATSLGTWASTDRFRVNIRTVNSNTMTSRNFQINVGTIDDTVTVPWEPPPSPPSAPTVTATGVSSTQIDLSWTASTGNPAPTYNVEASADAGTTWATLATGLTGTTYSHGGLTGDTTRHYRVTAVNSVGSATSAVVSATTQPPPANSGPYYEKVSPLNPVGWWRLSETSGTQAQDVTAGARHGTVEGANLNVQSPMPETGSAAKFDGIDDSIVIPTAAAFQTATWSFAIWLQRTSETSPTSTTLRMFSNAGTASETGWDCWAGPNNIDVGIFGGAGVSAVAAVPNVQAQWSVFDQMRLLTATYDGATLRVYVDGVEVVSIAFTAYLPNTTQSLRIGRRSFDATRYFCGFLDEPALWDRVLTADEVRTIYNAGVGGTGATVAAATAATTTAFPAPGVAQDTATAPAAHATAAAFPAAAVSTALVADVAPAVLSTAAAIGAAGVATAADAAPAGHASASTVPAPTVTATQAATASPASHASTSTIPAPTVTAAQNATPAVAALSTTATVGAAGVVAPQNQAVAAATLSGAAAFPTTAVQTTAVAAPGGPATTAAFPVPAAFFGATAAVSGHATAAAFPAATVATTQNASVAAATAASTAAFPAATVLAESGAAAPAATLATSAAVPAAAASTGSSLTPATSTTTAAFPSAVVTTTQNTLVAPAAHPTAAAVPALAIATTQDAAAATSSHPTTTSVGAVATSTGARPVPAVHATASTFTAPGAHVGVTVSATALATAAAVGAVSLVGATAPPTGLTVTAVSATRVDLTWTAVPSAAAYDIERNGEVIVFDHFDTAYSDTTVTSSTAYSYRVRSVA